MSKKSQRQWAKDWIFKIPPEHKNDLDRKISRVVESFFAHLITKHSSPIVVGSYQPMKDEVVWNSDLKVPAAIEIVYPQMLPGYQLKYSKVPDIILVPGLMFSPSGDRLGRGKGYFDRYLLNFSGLTLGVSYEARVGKVITEDHDYGVQGLITENGYEIFN